MDGTILDIAKICRTCLQIDDELKSLFSGHLIFNGTSVSEMISDICAMDINENDELPHQICVKCVEDVKTAFGFKKRCEKSYETLSSVLNICNTTSSTEGIKLEREIILKGASSIRDYDDCMNSDGRYSQNNLTHACINCEKQFPNLEKLQEHNRIHHTDDNEHGNQCKVCSKVYNRFDHLKRHMLMAHPHITMAYCEQCNKSFAKIDSFKRHMAMWHHKDTDDNSTKGDYEQHSSNNILYDEEHQYNESYKCDICLVIFKNEQEIEEHECIDDNKSEFSTLKIVPMASGDLPLLECKVEQSVGSDVENNYDSNYIDDPSHSDNELYKEDNESSDDDDQTPLSELRNRNHHDKEGKHLEKDRNTDSENANESLSGTVSSKQQQNNQKSVKTKETKKQHKCETCGKSFSRGTHLKRHALTHSDDKPYTCKTCDKGFTRLDHLNIHMHHHSDVKPFNCTICTRGFIRAEHLRKHKEARHGAKALANPKTEFCEVCKKGFTTPKYLQIHMKSHTDRIYSCKVCAERYSTKPQLTEHMKSHTHEKPYLCSECGLRFVRNDYLVIHMRRHKGEKPYKCKFCGKGFPRATDLTVHERYHTGEKTHLCTVCGKGFQRAYNLLVHMRVHTGERPYKCPHCSKSFAQGNDLKAHVRRHTGERFKCELCGDGFIQGYHLTQHKRQVHGIDMKSHIRRVEKFTTPIEQEQQMQAIQDKLKTESKTGNRSIPSQSSEIVNQDIHLEGSLEIVDVIKLENTSMSSSENEHKIINIQPHHAGIIHSAQEIAVVDGSNITMVTPVFYTQKLKYETSYE